MSLIVFLLSNFKNIFFTKIDPPKLNCNESYEVKEKTPFQHPCAANGLPKPNVSFYKNGKLIELPYNPKWNDSGWYQLTASNIHGTVNSTFYLTILCTKKFSSVLYIFFFTTFDTEIKKTMFYFQHRCPSVSCQPRQVCCG